MSPLVSPAPDRKNGGLRIATWNINGLRARWEFLLRWLQDRQPDVVGLQELKMPDERFPHDLIEAQGYQAFTLGQKSWNGVAVLSRVGGEVVQRGLPGQEALGARLLGVLIRDWVLMSVYCPNGKSVEHADYARKLAWFDALHGFLRREYDPEEGLFLVGDFNICPTPLDSWNEAELGGQIMHSDAERARFRNLLDCGLYDLYRCHHPETREFSWWDYRGGAFHKRQGLRIDFLLASRVVAQRLQRVEIDRAYRKKQEGLTASDHAPVIADLAAAEGSD